MRHPTRKIWVGNVPVGGDAPISVQSMTKTDTRDVAATVAQIQGLQTVGCEIIRSAVPDMQAAQRLEAITRQIEIPLIADIHFDYRLALHAIQAGVDGIRFNPGNIGSEDRVKALVDAAGERNIAIRIGVNAGSLERDLLQQHGSPTPAAMVASALRHVELLEKFGFRQMKISLKASDVPRTVDAYRLIAKQVDYPLHIGITEAGTVNAGTVKSAVGLGILLAEGLGDTLRVSLTGNPVDEVRVGYEILKALNLRQRGPVITSCPTCGRTEVDLVSLATQVEQRLAHLPYPLHVAVMGCVVNGPGEAKEADIGIAAGKHSGLLFKQGEILGKFPETELIEVLCREAEDLARRLMSSTSDKPSH
ncbi:flavodoxin-dependent (E)-4-hydroxy-3-methylbut-2-enyl-diphosphate synthase [candidate division KSB3 bacterium]|uniref:4-hydroxy-3-methylbut-2-en-1-yl diphosphate synthase (flavodoxin) n=1 Tax=candidate division KSB3 bacterium TaxID=2044937 RepID=A0A9D5JX69_9BACT|nr:flavodoxin-dependent (E)-4-hydroxy-3-methylbut-2-enyl-diphosphate synthase [candidate division KSB3 bacterium]MBD3325959.1 flavodoxin-dependent (E)-4-hydroxy-3-methylbut-2-enyl-diphosphate synthase [candidate division KSB3 bacterium]